MILSECIICGVACVFLLILLGVVLTGGGKKSEILVVLSSLAIFAYLCVANFVQLLS